MAFLITSILVLPYLIFASAQQLSIAGNGPPVRADGKYEICAGGIRAYFIPYGASLSNLFIQDIHGVERDIVLGFDNATYYSESALHPHLNGIPGRYANRISNGTFTIDSETHHTDLNENGEDTLHGGSDGWDWRNWTVIAHTTDSVTFSLVDPADSMGFPGEVTAFVIYTVTPYSWNVRMNALATTRKTPIMLTSHTYLNLDGFQNPHTPLALEHTLYMPHAGQRISTDGTLIPDGDVLPNVKDGTFDFWSKPKQLGANITAPLGLNITYSAAHGACGTGCTGYDTCFTLNRNAQRRLNSQNKQSVATLASPWSGIRLDIFTNQEAMQVYTCNNMNGTSLVTSSRIVWY